MTTPVRPTVLVTGASAGIGKELADRFAAGGHDLILTARRADELHALAASLADKYGVACHVIPADLADPNGAASLAGAVDGAGLTVDVLVNNAGFGCYGPFADADPDRLLAMIRVNVTALTLLTRLFLPPMLERKRGRILNVASTAAFQPGPLMAGYYATKAFVLSLSEALSEETRGTGVTVTCLCPGPTRTGFVQAAAMEQSKLFDSPNVMAVGPVADAGYRGTMRGTRVVIPGFANRLLASGGKFASRGLLLRIVRRVQEKRKH